MSNEVEASNAYMQMLHNALKRDIEETFNQKKEAMIKELSESLEREKDRIIGGLVVQVSKTMSISSVRNELIITVKSDKL